MTESIEIFFCYAREDEELRQGLEKQLQALQRQDIINIWHDRKINPGDDWEHEINTHLDSADIILLLLSPDFMNSDYCYSKEMMRAVERHNHNEARVIPVILRHVYWQQTSLGKFQALPTDGKPVTDPSWHCLDVAFFDIAEGIRTVAEALAKKKKAEKGERKAFLLFSNPEKDAFGVGSIEDGMIRESPFINEDEENEDGDIRDIDPLPITVLQRFFPTR